MTNEEKITQINRWQNSSYLHPLTCGNCHGDKKKGDTESKLYPTINGDRVVLNCNHCSYIQEYIPKIVLEMDVDAHDKKIEELLNIKKSEVLEDSIIEERAKEIDEQNRLGK